MKNYLAIKFDPIETALRTTARCEETTGYDYDSHDYTRCGAPAKMLVLSERGRRLYFMCAACGTHNVDNRGAVYVATIETTLGLRYGGGVEASSSATCSRTRGTGCETMKLLERYAVGTVVGEFEGRTLGGYFARCAGCQQTTHHETRAVADSRDDAEIEVCSACGRVNKAQKL